MAVSPLLVAIARTTDDPDLQQTLYDAFVPGDNVPGLEGRKLTLAFAANPYLAPALRARLAGSRRVRVRAALMRRDDVTPDEAIQMLAATPKLSTQLARQALHSVADPDGALATYLLDLGAGPSVATLIVQNPSTPFAMRLRAAGQIVADRRAPAGARNRVLSVFGHHQEALRVLVDQAVRTDYRARLAAHLNPVDELPNRPTIATLVAWLTSRERDLDTVIALYRAERRERARATILRHFCDPTGALARVALLADEQSTQVRVATAEAPEIPDECRKRALLRCASPPVPLRDRGGLYHQLHRYAAHDQDFASAFFSASFSPTGPAPESKLFTAPLHPWALTGIGWHQVFSSPNANAAHVLRVMFTPGLNSDLQAALYTATMTASAERMASAAGGRGAPWRIASEQSLTALVTAAYTGDFASLPVKNLNHGLLVWGDGYLGPLGRRVLDALLEAGAPTDALALEALASISTDFDGTLGQLCGSFAAVWC